MTYYVSSGVTSTGVSLNSDTMIVSSGGTVNSTTVSIFASMYISSGGTASNTTIREAGCVSVSSGGTANGVTINNGGGFIISSGGTATEIIENGGYVRVEENANVTFASKSFSGQTISATSSATIHSGTTANNTTVDSGRFYIYSGGTANNTTVKSRGALIVYSGGTANSTTVNPGGYMKVSSGGTANSVTVTSGGCIYFTSGGRLTGQTIIENGAYVSAYSGAILDFDISSLAPDALARVNGLSRVSGWKDIRYTLTVDGKQASGNYALAEGAAGFDRTISVVNTFGDELGTLAVGQKVSIGNTDYTLNLTGDALSVEVISSVVPGQLFYPGDFAGNKKSMLALEQDRVALIYNDGAIWGGLTLDDGWSIAGVGDFNGDGADDFLQVHSSGLVMGELSNGNGTFSPKVLNFKQAGWDILGTGDFNGNGMDDVLIANPTSASETVGLLGYWESGTTWTLINGYSPEWECVATGDYNGDGKCDMLWRNSFEGEGGLTYNAYCTWIVDDPVDWRMVSVANPDEWNFLCSGDFDGNKTSDIAMINKEGVVGIWGVTDGYLGTWSILSAVTSEWTLAGVADFNGDGTDDIAWSNVDTGLTGYWQIENKELASWQNIAVI